MSISDVFLTVDCDTCGDTQEAMLDSCYFDYSGKKPYYNPESAYARLRHEGWLIDLDSDTATCGECAARAEDDREQAAALNQKEK